MDYRLIGRCAYARTAMLVSLCLFCAAQTALANHGPGTSGGGSATASGETLKPGQFDLSLRADYTKFEDISREGAERRARESGGFDALSEATVTSLSISYGLITDFQICATIGYYWGNNFIDAELAEDGSVESAIADPEGITDLNLTLKYRLLKGAPGNLAVIGGVIVPTGRHNVLLDSGEPLEPSSQPGTGAWAYQIGLAYSRFLTSHLTVDASSIYTIRTPHDGFEVGDRVDLGVALAYRLTDSIKKFPNWSVFGEANAVWLGKDEDAGEKNPNSGGWTVYLTPGARIRFTKNLALTVAPSYPIVQELNGEQIESRFKLAATLSYSF
jgi:hypothetical protein